MPKFLVEFQFEPEQRREAVRYFFGQCRLPVPDEEGNPWSVWGGFSTAMNSEGKVIGYLEFLMDTAPAELQQGPFEVLAGPTKLGTATRVEVAPLGTTALLASLKPILEPIVHHIRGTYNPWRYKTNGGRSDGVYGMKYEDAVKALPKIYDNIKEK